MVTSEVVEALELFEGLLHDDAQRQAVLAVREMLCEWSEDEWSDMGSLGKQIWLLQYLPK